MVGLGAGFTGCKAWRWFDGGSAWRAGGPAWVFRMQGCTGGRRGAMVAPWLRATRPVPCVDGGRGAEALADGGGWSQWKGLDGFAWSAIACQENGADVCGMVVPAVCVVVPISEGATGSKAGHGDRCCQTYVRHNTDPRGPVTIV